jgi:hypothetical protein
MKHTGGSCPLLKAETAKKLVELLERREEAAKKHGVDVVNAWSPSLEHQMFWVVKAPSQKAVEEYFTETGFTLWNKLEIQKVEIHKE